MRFQLRVVYYNHVCPYKPGKPVVVVADCYRNSSVTGHFCANPRGGGRCDQVAVLRREYSSGDGWRSHGLALWPLIAENSRSLHPPVKLVFAAMNREGTSWFAVNVTTGERKRIVFEQRRWIAEDGALLEPPFSGWRLANDDVAWAAYKPFAMLRGDALPVTAEEEKPMSRPGDIGFDLSRIKSGVVKEEKLVDPASAPSHGWHRMQQRGAALLGQAPLPARTSSIPTKAKAKTRFVVEVPPEPKKQAKTKAKPATVASMMEEEIKAAITNARAFKKPSRK